MFPSSMRTRVYALLLLLLQLTCATGSAPVAGFLQSKWVKKDAQRFKETCLQGEQGRALQEWEDHYKTLDRILLIDATESAADPETVGTLADDYATWFVWAALTDRALFVKWSDDCPRRVHLLGLEGKCGMFNLADWFQGGNGASWAWDPQQESRLRTGQRIVKNLPEDFVTPNDLLTLLNDHDGLVVLNVRGVGLLPPEDHGLREYLEQTGYSKLLQKLGLMTPPLTEALPHVQDFPTLEAESGVHVRGCLLHWALHPKPRLQAALMPLLGALEDKEGLVAVHVRTFYADVAHLPESDAKSELQGHLPAFLDEDALERWHVGTAEERWGRVNEVLRRGGFARNNTDPLLARCRAQAPSAGAADAVGSWMVGAAGGAGLEPYFTCAGRAAMDAAAALNSGEAPAGRGDWAVYLATDAPVLAHLAPQLPALQGHLLHGCSSHGLGHCHVMHSRRAGGGRMGRHERARRDAAQAHLAVDAWMLGLASRTLPVTASAFHHFASRGFGSQGLPQLLHAPASGFPFQVEGSSFIPLCEGLGLAVDSDLCKAAYVALLEDGREESGHAPAAAPASSAPASQPAPVLAAPGAAAVKPSATVAAPSTLFSSHYKDSLGFTSPACTDDYKHLKIHIYPDETDDYGFASTNRHLKNILIRLREDAAVYTHDPDEANLFVLQYHQSRDLPMNANTAEEQAAWINHLLMVKEKFPYLERSIRSGRADHVVFFTGDHGPGDRWYQRELLCPKAGVPDWANPACAARMLIFAEFPGSHDWKRQDDKPTCLVCFEQGKDIRLPSADFDREALWKDAEEESMLTWKEYNKEDRTTFFSFKGYVPTIPEGKSIDWNDMTGRSQLNYLRNASGFSIGDYTKDSDAQAMRKSVFCYNPLGRFGGDSLRYVTATLFGCIPVWIARDGIVHRPYDDFIPWDRMSVTVSMEDIAHLPELLRAVSEAEREQMFLAMQQYWHYMFWGEGFYSVASKVIQQRPSSYEGLLAVLRYRLNNNTVSCEDSELIRK